MHFISWFTRVLNYLCYFNYFIGEYLIWQLLCITLDVCNKLVFVFYTSEINIIIIIIIIIASEQRIARHNATQTV